MKKLLRYIRKFFFILSKPRLTAFYIQRCFTKPGIRFFVARMMSFRLQKTRDLQKDKYKQELDSLYKDGLFTLGEVLSRKQLEDIKHYLKSKPLYERYGKNNRLFEGVDAIPEDCHTAAYSSDDLIRCPHILSLANNKKILDIVELYLGVKPTLALITSWWSVPGRREAKESQLFHRDMDDLRFIKFFIYLTDVNGSDDAAHVYVKESHNLNILTKAGRYSDSEVEKAFDKNNIIQITGKAGEGFLEDTFGIHKGNVSKSSKRLILQFQYSLHPIGTYDYNPLNISGGGYDSYINRLYIKQRTA